MPVWSLRRKNLLAFALLWSVFTIIISVGMYTAIISAAKPSRIGLDTPSAAELLAQSEATPTLELAPTPTLNVLQNRQFDLGVQLRETQPTVNPSVMAGYMDAARNQLHLNWVRLQMRWDFIEPEPGVYNWANWDTVFRLAAEYDLKVLVTMSGSPLWAREAGADPTLMAPPQDMAQFVEFVMTVLHRYPAQIHALEIWNEMNFRRQWAAPTGVDPAAYVQLIKAVAEAVRAFDSEIILISGGLEPTGGGEAIEAVDDFVYLDGMIEAGLLDVVDCVGVRHNGYNIGPTVAWDTVPSDPSATFRGPFDNPHHSWSFYSTLDTYARKIAAKGYVTPLCVTRFGWATTEDLDGVPPNLEFASDNTLQEQGRWIVQAIELMQRLGTVWLAFINNMNVGPEEAFDPQVAGVAYSLIRPDYAFSPAWLLIGEMNFKGRIR